jgi:hypothetical protein
MNSTVMQSAVVIAGFAAFILLVFLTVRIALQLLLNLLKSKKTGGGSFFVRSVSFCKDNSTLILSVLTVAVTALSWFLNIGWYRVIFMVPIMLHLVCFLCTDYYIYITGKHSKLTAKLVLVNFGVFNLCYLLLPDAGDTADSYRMFFGLIRSVPVLNAALVLSAVLCMANIVIMGLVMYRIRKSRKLRA